MHRNCKLFILNEFTCWISVPNLQVVKSADGPDRCTRVRFHVEALKVQDDFRHLWCEDDEGALEVVRVIIWETRGLDHPM